MIPRWPAEVTDGSVTTDCLIAGDSEDEEDDDDEDEGDKKDEEENEHDGYSE